MMTPNLTADERANLARLLREAIEADRYPLSPRVRRLEALLAKLAPPAPAVEPLPPPKPPSLMLVSVKEHALGSVIPLDQPR